MVFKCPAWPPFARRPGPLGQSLGGQLWRKLGLVARIALVSISFLGCGYALLLMQRFPALIPEEASDWLIALTASVFLISSIADTRFSRFLRLAPMQNFGKASYGIYLLHLPILFVFINLLWSRVPHLVVDAVALVVTVVAANLFYHFIELPSISLGKRIILWLHNSQPSQIRAAPAGAILDRVSPLG